MPVKSAANIEESLLKLLNVTGKGFILNNMPFMAKGLTLEVMKRYNITLGDFISAVGKNDNLWNYIDQKDYARIQQAAIKLGGDISWFTPEFFIDTIRASYPAIASLFLSDRRSMAWLTSQINIAKENIEKLKAAGEIGNK